MRIQFWFIGQENDAVTGSIRFVGKLCVVGRKDSDVVVGDAYCSRHHALLYRDGEDALWIRDLKSRNGTFLNGKRVSHGRLTSGDELKIGRTRMLLVDCGQSSLGA